MIALLLRDLHLVLFFREHKLDPNLEVFPLSSYCVSGFSSCLEQVLIRGVRYFIFKTVTQPTCLLWHAHICTI